MLIACEKQGGLGDARVVSKRQLGLVGFIEKKGLKFLRAVDQQKLGIHGAAATLALEALCFFDLHFIHVPALRLSSSSLGSWKEVDLRRRPRCGCKCGGS